MRAGSRCANLGVFRRRFNVPPGVGFEGTGFVDFDFVVFGLFAHEK
jgi:hypothetical protein